MTHPRSKPLTCDWTRQGPTPPKVYLEEAHSILNGGLAVADPKEDEAEDYSREYVAHGPARDQVSQYRTIVAWLTTSICSGKVAVDINKQVWDGNRYNGDAFFTWRCSPPCSW
jgi:hypothetical protein